MGRELERERGREGGRVKLDRLVFSVSMTSLVKSVLYFGFPLVFVLMSAVCYVATLGHRSAMIHSGR